MNSTVPYTAPAMRRFSWARFAAVAGPGMVVMLADTDAGSVITAAQSGAQWGYRLLLLQIVLAPVLFVVQELTVRLGIVSGKGHGDLIQQHFGRSWALLSVGTLVLACVGALLSELSGLAGVGLLFGIPAPLSMAVIVGGLVLMAYSGSYLSVERIATAIGAFELVFLIVAWRAHPDATAMVSGAVAIPWANRDYLYLVAANIGAVIMPLIMAAVLVATAATLGVSGKGGIALDTVQQIAEAITPILGAGAGKILFAMGMTGAALVATIVVTLTAARSLGEVLGVKHSLEHAPRDAPWFYGIYTAALVAGGVFVASGVNLVSLSVGVQVMNALLLPIVLGFLYLLARRLPQPYRLRGAYAAVVALVIAVSAGFGVYAGLSGIL